MSLATARVTTILPTSQVEMARAFYADVLGLPFRGADADGTGGSGSADRTGASAGDRSGPSGEAEDARRVPT